MDLYYRFNVRVSVQQCKNPLLQVEVLHAEKKIPIKYRNIINLNTDVILSALHYKND